MIYNFKFYKKIKKNGEIAPVGFEPTKANAATAKCCPFNLTRA